jgi:hypothetical protein
MTEAAFEEMNTLLRELTAKPKSKVSAKPKRTQNANPQQEERKK